MEGLDRAPCKIGNGLSVPAFPSDLFDLLFDRDSGGEYIAMVYQAYLDDSTHDGILVASGAIVGNKDTWNDLSKRWKDRLTKDNIEFFKSSHCKSLRGPFFKFRDFGISDGKQKAFAIRDDLDEIIRTSKLMMLGVTLSIPFFKVMKSDPALYGELPEVPYRLAFQQTVAECAKAMRLLGRGNIVTFGHDDGTDYSILRDLYKEFKKRNPKHAKVMGDFIPLDDKLNRPVQAADVAAEVIGRTMLESLHNPLSPEVKRLETHMYKMVHWFEQPHSRVDGYKSEEMPAKAVYAP